MGIARRLVPGEAFGSVVHRPQPQRQNGSRLFGATSGARPQHGRADETVMWHSSASRCRLTRFEGVRGGPSVHDRDRDCSRRELRPIGSRPRYGVRRVCSHRLCSSRLPRRVSIPGSFARPGAAGENIIEWVSAREDRGAVGVPKHRQDRVQG